MVSGRRSIARGGLLDTLISTASFPVKFIVQGQYYIAACPMAADIQLNIIAFGIFFHFMDIKGSIEFDLDFFSLHNILCDYVKCSGILIHGIVDYHATINIFYFQRLRFIITIGIYCCHIDLFFSLLNRYNV